MFILVFILVFILIDSGSLQLWLRTAVSGRCLNGAAWSNSKRFLCVV